MRCAHAARIRSEALVGSAAEDPVWGPISVEDHARLILQHGQSRKFGVAEPAVPAPTAEVLLRSALLAAYCASRRAPPTRSWEHRSRARPPLPANGRPSQTARHGIWPRTTASQYRYTGSWVAPGAIPVGGGSALKAGGEFRVSARKSSARTDKSPRQESRCSAGICVQPSQGKSAAAGIPIQFWVLGILLNEDRNCEVVLKWMRPKSRVFFLAGRTYEDGREIMRITATLGVPAQQSALIPLFPRRLWKAVPHADGPSAAIKQREAAASVAVTTRSAVQVSRPCLWDIRQTAICVLSLPWRKRPPSPRRRAIRKPTAASSTTSWRNLIESER